ncbi:hypothetical protein [Pantoea sp. S62]|uniref:hypothetical protein n=1 Tax=Pantoea sp. S62 TaxID=2769342 RepID=UPI001912CEC6|nr:hypothetical protein [Pantoea sp. S62]MBK5013934.1 hypothetical protein [Pantoea sp. S62]
MNEFKNVKNYKNEPLDDDGVYMAAYFCDELGRDWYETRQGWVGAVAVDANELVCSIARSSMQVQLFTMVEGQTLYEVDPDTIPVDPLGKYKYVNGMFTAISDLTSGP